MKHVQISSCIIQAELFINLLHIDFGTAHRGDVLGRAGEMKMQHGFIYPQYSLENLINSYNNQLQSNDVDSWFKYLVMHSM